MFVISRKCGESIVIVPAGATANTSSVEIRIQEVTGQDVKLAIEAPMFFRILRRPERLRRAEPDGRGAEPDGHRAGPDDGPAAADAAS